MGDSWHAFKTGFARTRQKVLAKVGQAEVTKSPEYEEECKKVLELQKTMKRVHDNTGKYLEVMRALIQEQELIAQDIAMLADLAKPSLEVATTMENERNKMGAAFGQFIDAPITAYMAQFKDLKDRMDELEVRRVDMDRYFRDYNAVISKSHPDPARVTHIETKYNVTKEGYTALFNEMMEDMPKLIADRSRFFEPIVAIFAKSHAAFYSNTVSAYEAALPSVAAIDDDHAQGHKAPITPTENSARTRAHRGGNIDYTSTPPAAYVPPQSHAPPATSQPTPTYPPSAYAPPPSSYPPPQAAYAPPPTSSYPPQNVYSSAPTPPYTAPPQSERPPSPSHHVETNQTPFEPTPHPSEPSHFTPTPEPTPAPAPAPVVAPTPAPTVSLQKGIKAKANFDFIAQDEDELSFRKGDIVTILNNEGDWWEGELNGARGNLPSNYVTVL